MQHDVAPHNMTSATAPRPFVVAWSSEYSGNYPGWKAFDGVVGGGDNGWATPNGTTTGWLSIAFGRQVTINQYAIQDRGSSATYCPRAFTFEGFRDGAWVVLDQRRGVSNWVSNERKTFTVLKPGAYSSYRLNVTEANGGTLIVIGELYLYETPTAPTAPTARGFVGKRYLGSETPTTFPPRVDPGPDQYLFASEPLTEPPPTATLAGSSPDAVTFLWTKVWGPGTATFVDDTDPATDVDCSVAGVYRLRLTVTSVGSPSETAYRDVTITFFSDAIAQIAQVVTELLDGTEAESRHAQVVVELLSGNLRVPTLAPSTVVGQPFLLADTAVSQLVVEVLQKPSVSQVVSQFILEYLFPTPVPVEVEFFSDVLGLLIWIEWTHVDANGDPQTLVFAKVPLADPATYYGGWKDARVTVWGKFRRALSDRKGQYEVASLSWSLSDTDRLLRGMLTDPVMRYVQNRTVAMRMIDDATRRSTDPLKPPPRLIARGIIRNCKPNSPLQVEFTAEDFLSSVFSTMNFAKQIPQRVIDGADFPSCPQAALGTPVPIIYGALTDSMSQEVTVGPGNDLWWVADGSIGAHFFGNGRYYFAGYGHQVSNAAAPTNVVAQADGPGSGSVSSDVPNYKYGFMVVAIDANGAYSDPCPFFVNRSDEARGDFYDGVYLTVPTCTLGEANNDHSITVTWTASAGAVRYRIYMMTYYFGARPEQALEVNAPTTTVTFTTNPGWTSPPGGALTPGQVDIYAMWRYYAVSATMSDGESTPIAQMWVGSFPFRRTIRLEWTAVAGALGYHVWRNYAFSTEYTRFAVAVGSPPSAVEYFEDDMVRADGEVLSALPTSTGIITPIVVGTTEIDGQAWTTLLVAGHACAGIDEWFVDGVRVPDDTRGTTWLIPDSNSPSLWPYPTPYVDINSRRYTLLFTRGPDADLIAAGTKTVTLNLRGIETVGDGSGALITDLHAQYLHACVNWLFQSYQSGAWLPSPVWPPDVNGTVSTQIDAGSFSLARSIAAAALSGGSPPSVVALVGAWALGLEGAQVSLRDVLAMLNLNAGVESGFNRHSQFFVSMLDPDVDLSAALHFPQATDIVAASFDIEDQVDDLYNRLPYAYRRDYRSRTWLAEGVVEDADSIANYLETRSDDLLELFCIRDPTTAGFIVAQHLARSAEPPRLVCFRTTLRGLSDGAELGKIITVDHIEGLGPNGWVGHPLRVVRHEFDPDRFSVLLECIDVSRLLNGSG